MEVTRIHLIIRFHSLNGNNIVNEFHLDRHRYPVNCELIIHEHKDMNPYRVIDKWIRGVDIECFDINMKCINGYVLCRNFYNRNGTACLLVKLSRKILIPFHVKKLLE